MATRTDSAAQGSKPTLEDFPDAEIIGGAVICEGKNMGTLMVTGEVETSAAGNAYLAAPPEQTPLALNEVEVTDPAPPGVFDPKDHEPVKAVAKREVRRRKQNEVNIDAMNSPTEEEEAAMKAADDAMIEGEAPPPAGEGIDGQSRDGLEAGRRPSGHPGSGDQGRDQTPTQGRNQGRQQPAGRQQGGPGHEGSVSSGAAQQPPASY
jgi:hypothetical protein